MAIEPAAAAPEVRGGEVPPATSDSLPGGAPAWDESAHDEPNRSLLSDLEAAWADGKTYLAAELAFQKTRARFATAKLKTVVVFGIAAVFVAILALIGLTVGAILSLATLVGPLAATLIVVAVLLLVAFILAKKAARSWTLLSGAFSDDEGAQS